MTKISRRALDKNLEKYIFTIFLKTIVDLKTLTEVKNFLEDLLSPTEKIMLIKRLAIAVMLTKGYTYDEIDHTLKVARNTIMNVSYFLKHSQNEGYQKVVTRVLADQKKEALFDKIEELLIQFSPPKLYGSGAYERKRRIGKELFKRKSLRDNF
ncbi:hypothetical protein A2697_03160 [Candidatus Curtissbacteria bacterium RIFCSPHIGHO2_01_FULL_41_44]|uniref:TrpR like protein, YerC/YecD n=1 Tax=Candidatus Curtissbacteria bacterium RIFCSPLOWO2_01_FULL_42_50 TaxID=1797730 RepID=A0A1F5H4E9_9BACT|nr:MAG: hypothetical protein A2697_03160 [Candidatus Curtissbacteria bacterium RIFCSPHIGHO2_01_FULL_41_44]OGD93534.1 MAG: hypothetical protein A3C33_00800 [Candidatus Curtissbacteria bacterium RIFCSPHIGHO2_02_FULL_42_58]OGD97842.1 MAG: hypothetical protein A3E71_04695 [Candidatus Curtissbacteria bacterium RIFCSPHIGHO2_12_FULL_42_33]OGD99040.1 MAG: hypothetical protein A3B54_04615 [Candidatus Curtissbacteria bacterium RIFCSPLOWO2_01_FULL_42_50]OGE03392.1 MAG: hypothetical protein A3G16_01535 [Ca